MNSEYPVLEILPQIRAALTAHRIVILQAPPGAGKSTVLPLHLLNEEWLSGGKIVMLEPRRLAARSVAHRLSALLGEAPGNTVGYKVRFENNVSAKTKIEVVTEGILTRQIQNDTALENTGLVIFDEFHERSLQADLALTLCLQVQQILRSDLRLLIMSATLETGNISTLLGNAPVITSNGKQFPVTFNYYTFDPDAWLQVRMARAIKKALQENKGDVLAFFPGAGEIRKTEALLQEASIGAAVHVLYGDLPMKQQQAAIEPEPGGARKVVLSTSIAETSLTIEGITVVVDSGYSRVPRFDPRSGLTRLETTRVTKDSATQRAGRAGRLGPGVCYRLWSEGVNASLVVARTPEILDADLAPLMLDLSQWGASNLNEMTWITPPPPGAVAQARELLDQLGATADGKITGRGKRMLSLPTHPRIAHMLLEAEDHKNKKAMLPLATDIAALLEERDPLGKESGVDVTLRLEVLRKWRAGDHVKAERNILDRVERLAESWRKIFRIGIDNAIPADTDIGLLIAAAYPERIARQTQKGSERYTLSNGRRANLPTHDPLVREAWIAIAQLDGGTGEGKIFLAAPLNEGDLLDLGSDVESVRWDEERGMIVGAVEKRIGSVILGSKPLANVSDEKRVELLIGAVRAEGLKILGWGEKETQWQSRIMSLKIWRPQEAWPDMSTDGLLSSLEEWLTPYLNIANKRADLARLDINAMLTGILPWDLAQRAQSLAPESLEVPSGSMIALNYFDHGQPPTMEVRLQEVFGMLETPAINNGTIRIILHLLSPGYKPVQVTQDLKSFWQTAYHEVRKELRIRYRKHSWPEDPWTAKAVRGAIKKRG